MSYELYHAYLLFAMCQTVVIAIYFINIGDINKHCFNLGVASKICLVWNVQQLSYKIIITYHNILENELQDKNPFTFRI